MAGMDGFEGRNALITGAADGIGAALAAALQAAGAKVFLADINAEKLAARKTFAPAAWSAAARAAPIPSAAPVISAFLPSKSSIPAISRSSSPARDPITSATRDAERRVAPRRPGR